MKVWLKSTKTNQILNPIICGDIKVLDSGVIINEFYVMEDVEIHSIVSIDLPLTVDPKRGGVRIFEDRYARDWPKNNLEEALKFLNLQKNDM